MIEHDALALQIRYTWHGRLVGVRQIDPSTREVRLATEQGWYWSLLGLGIGWVRPGAAPLLRTSPPMLSDVSPRLMGDFIVPDGALAGDGSVPVWHRYPGGCGADVELAWKPRVLRRGRVVDPVALAADGRWRASGDRVWIDLSPDLELEFDVGGCVFSTSLVGPAPRVGPVEVEPDHLRWILAGTAVAAVVVFFAALGWVG